MKFRPTDRYVVIKVAEKPTTTPGGLYLPPSMATTANHSALEQQDEGTIVALGPQVEGLKLDERVIFRGGGPPIKDGDAEYIIIRSDNILSVIEE